MRQKEMPILSDVKGKTEWEERTRKTEMAVWRLWSHFCLEECLKQAYQATHLVYPVDC
jgi:hypothetical protein